MAVVAMSFLVSIKNIAESSLGLVLQLMLLNVSHVTSMYVS